MAIGASTAGRLSGHGGLTRLNESPGDSGADHPGSAELACRLGVQTKGLWLSQAHILPPDLEDAGPAEDSPRIAGESNERVDRFLEFQVCSECIFDDPC